jgi:hypothetical protein
MEEHGFDPHRSGGWSHKDWEGVGYPTRRPKGFQKATYLAHYFETVEINSTPSRSPLEYRIARNRVRRVSNNPGLRITAKLFRGFTHERNAGADDERQFKEGIDPLVEAGRLGALLLPFPWSCENDEGNRISVRLVPPHPLLSAGPRSATYGLGTNGRFPIRSPSRGIGLCSNDQHRCAKSIAPSAQVTSSVGYIRLPGHNCQNTFTENTQTGDPFQTTCIRPPWRCSMN